MWIMKRLNSKTNQVWGENWKVLFAADNNFNTDQDIIILQIMIEYNPF